MKTVPTEIADYVRRELLKMDDELPGNPLFRAQLRGLSEMLRTELKVTVRFKHGDRVIDTTRETAGDLGPCAVCAGIAPPGALHVCGKPPLACICNAGPGMQHVEACPMSLSWTCGQCGETNRDVNLCLGCGADPRVPTAIMNPARAVEELTSTIAKLRSAEYGASGAGSAFQRTLISDVIRRLESFRDRIRAALEYAYEQEHGRPFKAQKTGGASL